jgi:putative endopeptidase
MISLSRRAMGASMLALLAGCATKQTEAPAAQAAPPRPPAKLGSFGVDLASRDLSVKPGDDFFRYANGTWTANNQIPADRTRWGSFDILRDQAEKDVRAIIQEVAAAGGAPGSKQQKIADFYNSFLDVDAIDAKGLAPAQADLALIAAARNHEDIIRLIGMPGMPVNTPIAIYVSLDDKNPNRYVVGMTQAGLSLPDREYYIKSDAQFAEIRAQFTAHVERMLTLAGQQNGARKARAILALETEIARRHWPIEDRRERDKTYNLLNREQIRALDPRFPWDAGFDAAEMGDVQEVVVAELSAMAPLAQLFRATPVATWRDYLTYHYLSNCAPVLPRAIDAENFDFYGHTLNGQPQQRERWKRGVDAVNAALGEAIGEIYVTRHFPPEAKAQMLALVENLRTAYGQRIDQIDWMTAETKVVAREKLATFRPKIGYPDRWRDYAGLDVVAGDAFGNAKRQGAYDWRYDLARLPRPTDKDEWFMTPQVVNAYYNPVFNEVVFPAAILQPPFFDPNADAAVNYGGIGGVIGHEMGHGFDDQGAKSDAQGVLRDWWSEADVAAFHQRTQALVAQYSAFEPQPGLHVNGQLTLGENIGDNGGLQVSYHAYKLALGAATAPDLDGVSGDQRFFLGWAQVWQELIRDQRLRNQVLSDPHSPAVFRVNGVVRNMEAWYAAFNVQPGEALYLAPADRVLIW